MKVRFLKPHLNAKPGDEIDLDDRIAHYLVRCGVVEYVDNEENEKILVEHLEESEPTEETEPKKRTKRKKSDSK